MYIFLGVTTRVGFFAAIFFEAEKPQKRIFTSPPNATCRLHINQFHFGFYQCWYFKNLAFKTIVTAGKLGSKSHKILYFPLNRLENTRNRFRYKKEIQSKITRCYFSKVTKRN
ncbi:MAG: hypothetical protein CVU01_03640 [Bacteroidetes bacterium HGW-Bacteroidetes-18]|nr:MAG: hypothetical protein CVU01_03640 [Bacteroidetes bacterium HGW-Bacteroidetes-18]